MTARIPLRLRVPALLGGLLIVAGTAVLAGTATTASARPTSGFAALSGDGSSWAQPAIDQFATDVRPRGISVAFQGDGSAAGRQRYSLGLNDFAGTDVQYLTQGDPFGTGPEAPPAAPYSYIPIVAGGTSFLYNLVVAGKKVTNLRLSGTTITRIFTGQITNWDDPAIGADYYGASTPQKVLPNQKITPVTRSDGSGATYQFTRYMYTTQKATWLAFGHAHRCALTCGPTEFYPTFGESIQRAGSDQVASYISSSTGEGAIGYDEYSYALTNQIPVVKVLNAGKYYTLPTASNVAIALQKAQIDENPADANYLIQNLDNVYTNPDPRTYPLSSYSYLIVPRGQQPASSRYSQDPNKGYTLSHYLNYALCAGQQEASSLGYSPLPVNLFSGGFHQVSQIPGYDPSQIPNPANYNACNNPTYHNGVNYLTRDAPQPSPCDKVGTTLACTTTSAGSTNRQTGSRGVGGGGGVAAGGGKGTATQASGQKGVAGDVLGGAAEQGTDASTANVADTSAVGVSGRHGGSGAFATLSALLLLAAVATPAAAGLALRRRGGGA